MPSERYKQRNRSKSLVLWIDHCRHGGRPSHHPYHLLRRKAEVLDFLSQWNEALRIFQQNREVALAGSFDDLSAQSTVDVATVLHGLSRFEETRDLLVDTSAYYQRTGNETGLSRSLLKLGNAYVELADYRAAEQCYLKVVDLCQRHDNFVGLSAAYGDLGNVHYFCDRLDQALECYLKDLELARKLDNKIGLAATYRNLGNIYYTRNNYPEALTWYIKQQAMCITIGDIQGQGASWFTMGEVHRKTGDVPKSRACYGNAMDVFRRLGDNKWVAHVLSSLSELDAEDGFPRRALEQNAKACAIFREYKLAYYLAYYLCARAELLISCGDHSGAAPLLAESLDIGQRSGSRELVFNATVARAKMLRVSDPSQARQVLEALLPGNDRGEELSVVYTELFLLTCDWSFRDQAIKLYTKLYAETGAPEFKLGIDRLSRPAL